MIITTAGLAVLAAGCGGSSRPAVAALGATTTTTTASAGSAEGKSQANMLEYSHCMRAHGIPDFPDPNSKGEISLGDQPGSDLNPSDPALQAAQRSCAHFMTGGKSTAAAQAQSELGYVRFARCVRAHGVPNFPDPSSDGPWGLVFLINRNTIDRHSPILQAAITTCQNAVHIKPGFKSYAGAQT